MEMIKVYLLNENYEYEFYDFTDWFVARKEFQKRNIKVAENTMLEHVYISNGVVIKSKCIIRFNTVIGSGSIINHNCFIREHCIIGSNCNIGNHNVLEEHVTIQNNVVTGNNIHLGYRVILKESLERSMFISDEYFDNTVSYVGGDKFHKGCFPFTVSESPAERKDRYIQKYTQDKSQSPDNKPGMYEQNERLIEEVLKPFTKFNGKK